MVAARHRSARSSPLRASRLAVRARIHFVVGCRRPRAQAAAELDEYADALSDEELDAGERAQLQEENALLFGQMNTMANEAEQRMADIAAMSSQLSHYLHEQDEAIGEIRKDLDVTNDNLQTGNAYLDSAARHSRDFRIFILTFLLVASFSLLFLDWYYD